MDHERPYCQSLPPGDLSDPWKQKYEDLIKLAREVRRAQKQYFRTRSRDDLIEAKKLEDQLDDTLFT